MINTLLLKIGGYFVEKLTQFFPNNIPLNAFYYNLKKEPIEENKEKITLNSITILKDDKALLTYKGKDEKYFTKSINYRVGEIKPITCVIIGPY